ncbi:carboxymuconolactone decarboxylase family protein [Shewanella psychropiezotolerans]|uniref:Carboxymuconolactone decarboxylase family protein n=1 Tax=Shewanella psychropiezotolerans TaxID=2593655 RepID=A0ABX5X0W8_9GAMM|nr:MULTISPECIES: carboxymuconolactone decarboxylase family protein [Shewanella]MPY21366.1 carboxymuconolactone decarboxylase family protein [Shewanella sp. YLB-07]MPY22153.1 carboxymuconolactone decarboxylase family protein [Shewanella sp. YLB-07]QDO84994.1 carboxymuconolactone decarboxylase family protein [Shewanella psychropiezotolerans]
MQRITTLTVNTATGQAQTQLTALKKAMGAEINLFGAIANSSSALEGFLNFKGSLEKGVLSKKLSEQLALTIAGTNGCHYCASAHAFIGGKLGLSEAEIRANLNARSEDSQTNTILSFARQVIEQKGRVTTKQLAATEAAGFNREQLVEVIAHIALNTFTNYFNEAFEIDIDFPKISLTE